MKARYSLLLVGLALLSTLTGADDVARVPPFIAYANDETANNDVRKGMHMEYQHAALFG